MGKKKNRKIAKSKTGKKAKKLQKKHFNKTVSPELHKEKEQKALIPAAKITPAAATTFSKKLEEVIAENETETKKGLFGGKIIFLGPPGEYLQKDWKALWKRFTRGLVRFLVIFVILLVCAGAALTVEAFANGRVYPRVALSQQQYGLLPAAEANSKLIQNINDYQKTGLTFIYGKEKQNLSLEDLKIVLLPDQTVEQLPVFNLKQNGFFELVYSLFSEKNIIPISKKDDRLIFNTVEQKLKLNEKRARPASFYLDDKKNLQIKAEQSGIVINQAALLQDLNSRLITLSNEPIEIKTLQELPAVTFADLDKEKEDLLLKFENQISIKSGKQVWKFNPLNHLDNLTFRKENDQIVVLVSPALVSGFFQEKVFSMVEKPVSPLKIFYNEKGEVVFEGKALDGEEVNKKKFVKDLEMAINSLDNELELLVEKKKATLEIDPKLQELGIRELLGTGHTSFSGSPANRRHNIKNGMSKFNGVLIKPGEEFSFNTILGEVDGSTGYKLELVIKAEGTVPEYGGGICQVSSTMYKAALFAGLPIVERAPHSYAVSYYAQIDGYGLDSTIYPGVRDLRFTNDTSSSILIQTFVDGDHAYINFFGTGDGRQVRLENYWRGNYRGAGGTQLIPTKTLPPGARKQIESAHGGFDASWDRIITKNGVETREKIYSVYRATSNRILVGEGAAPATP